MSSGELLKSMVYGAMDGIVTTFAIVCAAAGAEQSDTVIVTMGVANLIADSISMGMGDYISENAEQDFALMELKSKQDFFRENPEQFQKDLISFYVNERGMQHKDAAEIVTRLAKYEDVISEHALTCINGIQPPTEENTSLMKGLVTAASFIIFGAIPLLIFILKNEVGWLLGWYPSSSLAISSVATACTMFLLGVVRGSLTRRSLLTSGLTMTAHGLMAAYAAFIIGQVLEGVYNTPHA